MNQIIVSVPEALSRWHHILQSISRPVETIPYTEGIHRILATPLRAKHAYPPYRKSPFDGYALGKGFTGTTFTVIATIGAGEVYDKPVGPTEAVRLMTGCAVPDYCGTVVMQEQVERHGNRITITSPIEEGENIIPIGEECQADTMIAPPGTVLTSGLLAAAVGLGCHTMTVYKKIKVLLLTSGHELLSAEMALTKGKIYNSNKVLLKQLLLQEGTATVTHYHVSDEPHKLDYEKKRVSELSQDADMIISTGGVSVGLFDTMPDIYAALGATQVYTRLTMRPGSASYGGYLTRANGQIVPILGLSGNPAAAFNAYHLLGRPIFRHLAGHSDITPVTTTCRMCGDIQKKGNPVDRYIQGIFSFSHGLPTFTPNQVLTSSALLGLAQTNALAMIPKGAPPCHDGDTVTVLLLE